MMSLDEILKEKLKKRPDVSDHEWTVWEHKTLNMHRVVLVWQPEHPPAEYSKIPGIVRAKVESFFKVATFKKEKDKLMKFLTSATRFSFPEYENTIRNTEPEN
jgi:hypothetical protein